MHSAGGFPGRSKKLVVAVVAALSIWASSAAALAQHPRIVTLTRVSCTSCRIVADSVAYVGHPDDTITVTEISPPARDSRGRYYAMADGSRRVAYAFDARGRLLQSFGTAGQGPGEFSSLVTEIRVGRGDTLFFFERNKVHVFSPDYRFARTITTAMPGFQGRGTALLANGSVLVPNAQSQFTLLDAAGQRIGAGPVALQDIDPSPCLSCRPRHFSAANQPGTVWSAPENAYTVEQHDVSGKLLARFSRQVSWFTKWGDSQDGGHGDIRPELVKSRLAGVSQGPDGLLWTYTMAPDPDFPLPQVIEPAMLGSDSAELEFMTKYFAMYVEVIDPAAGQLLATRKFKGMLLPISDGYAGQYVPDQMSGNAFRIVRMSLAR